MVNLKSRYTIEPPEPEPIADNIIVAHCPLCGKEICYGDKDIFVIDGFELMIHEDCMVFKKFSPSELLDRLSIDSYKVTAKNIIEEGY